MSDQATLGDPSVDGIFNIKPQSEYLGGFIATGLMAIVQTTLPLFLYQLWMKEMLMMDSMNMWYQYAWQAMQAGGVVSYGIPALAFLGNFIFEFNLLERLGVILVWITHGGILSMLSFITVIAYLSAALAKYEDSMYSDMTEMGITMAVYGVTQIGFGILAKYFMMDTVMYMLAGEIKEICEKYGELCSDYGILDKNDSGNDFEETDGTSLSTWAWM